MIAGKVKVLMALGLLGLAGCATKEMESTPFYTGNGVSLAGPVEERVNVWPVVYWREPVGSVVWPVVSFSDTHFALRPMYSQYRQNGKEGAFDEFNLVWPLCQFDFKGRDYRVFPVFWGDDADGQPYQTVFPVYWNGAHYNSLFPVYTYKIKGEERSLSALFGLAGMSKDAERESNWGFPLWYWNSAGTLVTLVYGRWENGWAVPPLLSWGESAEDGTHENYYLLGFGGDKLEKDLGEAWAFPIFGYDWWERDGVKTARTRLLMNLLGWDRKNGKTVYSYALPLWSWNDKGSLVTILGGREVDDGGETTSWMVTPFFGVTSGKKNGGWIFPLWFHYKQRDFEESAAILEGDRLPEEIKLWQETVTNMTWNAEHTERNVPEESTRNRGDSIWSKDWTAWLVLCAWEDTVSGHVADDYVLSRWIERGNPLVFEYEWNRRVHFDFASREKTVDRETSEATMLIWLYRYKREANLMTGKTERRHNVLWKLWDWVEQDGNVALDVFPGFTYDSRTNGYRKTSWLWRLFRYESDPQSETTAVDFLFVPVWR